MRAQIELLSKQQGAGKSLEEPSGLGKRGSGLGEGGRMDVEEEMQSSRESRCETSLSSPSWSLRSEKSRKRSLGVCCKRSKGKGQTFCQSTRKYKRVAEAANLAGQEKAPPQGFLCEKSQHPKKWDTRS